MSKLDWKQGHAAGSCDLIMLENERILTCGSEGEIREGEKTLTQDDASSFATMAFHSNRGLAVGTEEHFAKLYSLSDDGAVKFEKNLTRCTAPVRHVSFSPTGLFLAVASEECDLRLINMINTKQVITLKGHEGPIKSAVWDPKGDFLATTSEDGTLKIWRVEDRKVVYNFTGLKMDGNGGLCRPQWSHDGSRLAIPGGRVDDVIVLIRDEWSADFALSGAHSGSVDVVAWSPNAKYMLTGCNQNEIYLWDMKTRETIAKYDCESQIMALRWATSKNLFAVLDFDGRYAACQDAVPSHMAAPFEPVKKNTSVVVEEEEEESKTQQNETDEQETKEDTTKEKLSFSKKKKKKSKKKKKKVEDDDDEVDRVEIDSDDDGIVLRKRLKKKKGVDDSVAALREELGLDPLGEDEDDEDDEDESDSDREDEDEMMMRRANERAAQWAALPPPPKNELQPILQPGSTPIRDERRFLVWNSVGSIVSRSEDTFCALEFEFSNMSKHKTIRMTDHYRFTMAALGDRGALLASEGEQKEEFEFESDRKSKKKKNEEEDGKLLSTLYYRPFASWSHNSDWTQQLPKGERVICVTLGDTWCAASTSENLTRVWRFSGLQDMVFANTDPVVSLAGHGQYFAIVTRSGSPSDSTQHLSYEILNVPERKKLVSGRLPMSKGSELEWLGFDDQGTLMMYESTGKLHGLYSVFGWKWVTLCDTSKLDSVKKSNGHHWVIGVSGGQLLTALCVNKTTFPSAFPKPVPCATPLAIPVIGANVKSGKLEEEWLRTSLLRGSYDDAEDDEITTKQQVRLDKICLQLMQVACKSDRLARALDIATRLKLKKSFEIAVALAQRMGHGGLAERISLLMHARARAQAEESIAVQQMSFQQRRELEASRRAKRRRKKAVKKEEESEDEFDVDNVDIETSEVKSEKPSFFSKKKKKKKKRKSDGNKKKNTPKKKKKKTTTPKKTSPKRKREETTEEKEQQEENNVDEKKEASEEQSKSVLAPAKMTTDENNTSTQTDEAPKEIGTPVRKKKKRTATNPFARKTFSSPKKSQNIFEAVQKSPLKTPVLSRQSSFSIAARANRNRSK